MYRVWSSWGWLRLVVLVAILLALAPLPADADPDPGWYDPNWKYREKITIDYTKVPNTNQSYFPVLINITDTDWKDTANGGHVGQSDGGDILFTSSDGTSKLDHEIEKYTASTGNLTAWVEVPTLSASADTEIYIYYGNADAADQWNITGTWDEGGNNNFKGVWHLKESLTGASGEVKDSTGANDGTGIPTNASYTGPSGGDTGQIDNAVYFDATDDGVEMSDFFGAWTSATLEAWVNITTYSSWDAILGQPHTSFADPYVTTALALHTSNNFYMSISVDGLTRTIASSADNSAPTGAWIHVVGVWNGTNIQMYVNGSTSGSPASISGNLYNNTENVYIGYYPLSFPNYLFDGTIDEVRVSDTDRSADWIATCYNNQSDTTIGAGHFIKEVGSEEVGGWESYKESAHATPWGTEADPYDTDTQTVYMYGEGFATSYAYRVAYYDAPGTKTEDAHKIQAHDTDSGASGNLSSQYLLSTPEKQASSDPGTWHAIVCDRTYEPPSSYNATWQYTIVDDSFEVTAGAIPEFPTVLAALAVVGLCCGVYFWMRRRTARVKA